MGVAPKLGGVVTHAHVPEYPVEKLATIILYAQGSFIEERHDLDDNSCRTCGAHGSHGYETYSVDASVCSFFLHHPL